MAVSPQKPLAHPIRTFEDIRKFAEVAYLHLKNCFKALLAKKCIFKVFIMACQKNFFLRKTALILL